MHAVILAAGRGSRMGDICEDYPKSFLGIQGRTVYEWQLDVLDEFVDNVTIVLGHGFEDLNFENPDHKAQIYDLVSTDHDVEVIPTILGEWDKYDNAESLRLGIITADDDVMVVNGDVLFERDAIKTIDWANQMVERNVVAYIPGVQDERTAIDFDHEHMVTDYGKIEGHMHSGLGVIKEEYQQDADFLLRKNGTEWYPIIYPEIPTFATPIRSTWHHEINTKSDLEDAPEFVDSFQI